MMTTAGRMLALSSLAIALGTTPVLAADPVAVITETRPGNGQIGVRLSGRSEWQPAQPLLALRPGDQVRATGDARAVVVLTGGGSTHTVTAASSPLTVEAPATATSGERAQVVVARVTSFLLGQQRETTYRSLSVRSARQPPLIVAPRSTRVLPDRLVFDWRGSDLARYTVRVIGPRGLVWQQADVPRAPLAYPSVAPPLEPGARYRWELEAPGHPPARAEFEVLASADAVRVREALTLLGGYPPNTAALMRAAYHCSEGLYAEARRELLLGITADSEEPAFHQLLGHVYEQTGLRDLAAEALDEADFLSRGRP
jgi:hypothetical protein